MFALCLGIQSQELDNELFKSQLCHLLAVSWENAEPFPICSFICKMGMILQANLTGLWGGSNEKCAIALSALFGVE